MGGANNRDARETLKSAVAKLAAFASGSRERARPHLYDLELRDDVIVALPKAPVKRAIALTRSLLVGSAAERERTERLHTTIVTAIDDIKDHALLVEQLRHGDPAEQRLATAAHAVIDQYNALVESGKKRSIRQRVARYLYQKAGWLTERVLANEPVDLHRSCDHHIARLSKPQRVLHTAIDGIAIDLTGRVTSAIRSLHLNDTGTTEKATKGELDAYRMKAISLLQRHGTASLKHAIDAVHNTPIVVEDEKSNPIESSTAPTIVSFKQRVQAVPGQEIILEGAFQRTEAGRVGSVPIPNSFRLSTRPQYTAFPSAALSYGWALSDDLIPTMPLHPERMPILADLLHRRRALARDLLSNPETIARADAIAQYKRRAFERRPADFLQAHKTLSLALGIEVDSVERYFDSLRDLSNQYQLLSLAHQTAVDLFVNGSIHSVIHNWPTSDDASIEVAADRLDIATNLYRAAQGNSTRALLSARDAAISPFEVATLDYLRTHGERLSTLCEPIALATLADQLSMVFTPTTGAHQRLQAVLYRQQEAYLEDLSAPNSDSECVGARMFDELAWATHILTGDDANALNTPLLTELSG